MLNIPENLGVESISDAASPYEAILQDLERRGLRSDSLSKPTAPEDLSSRHLFTHEQSREPGLYDAALSKYEKTSEEIHKAMRIPTYG